MKRICLFTLTVGLFVVAGCGKKAMEVTTEPEPMAESTVETIAPETPKVMPLENDGSWVVTASSTEAPEFAPAFAVDGDIDTRWSTEWVDGQWLLIDFQQEEILNAIKLYWEDAYARECHILISTDNENWTEVVTETQGAGGEKQYEFEAQPARWVKIEIRNKATQWGVSIVEVVFNPQPEIELIAETTASSGSGDYAAKYAVDGDMSTRWSSNFGDKEWWQIHFDEPSVIAGVKINWETAFAEKYSIQVSDDGQAWTTVYDVPEGDGRTDLLFFKPVETEYLRIQCRQRGTGWGNSIHEIAFFEADEAVKVTAGEGAADAPKAMDGDRQAAWHSGAVDEAELTVELPQVFSIGGVEIGWTEDHARGYAVDITSDGTTWKTVSEVKLGNGGYDYAFFPASNVKKLRIRCLESATGNGYGIGHLEFKGGEEQATPIREYKAAAKDAPRGYFPRWLLREQEYWNVVGVIDDWHESLIGESGTIEPYKGGFSVMPVVLDGEKMYTWADVDLEQRLERNMLPMPTATWVAKDWNLHVSAVAFGPLDKSSTAVRYRLANKSQEPFVGKLALAIRPVQLSPVWQHGGMSPIHNVKCFVKDEGSYLEINGQPKMVSLTQPDAMGAAPLGKGDVIDYIADGKLPPEQEASHKDGMTSAGILYDVEVPPGESRDVIVTFLLHDESKLSEDFITSPEKGFDDVWEAKGDEWWEKLNRFNIKIPEQRLINIMKSNLAYILINKDGPWIKPGSRNYAHAWIRDGAMTSVTLLRMGLNEMVKRYIEAYTPLIGGNGWCPFIILEGGNPVAFQGDNHEGQEYDSQGQYAFLVRQYYDYTADQDLVESVYPSVVSAMKFGQSRRRMRMTDEYKNGPYFGILPESNSHEGYFPAKHSYWDDFWMLAGLKDASYLARQLGHDDDAAWIKDEELGLREDLVESIMAVIKRDRLEYIPGCVELGDFDATSTAIAIMACGEKENLPEPYRTRTFDRYFEDFENGTQPGQERTFTPYEVRSADAFVRMGDRDKALAMLRYFTKDSVRPYGWNHFAEVVHARPRAPSYIGDMPHTWVGSGYINAVRSMFAYEYNGKLILAGGLDPAWPGQSGVVVEDLPTQYGLLSYEVSENDGVITIDVQDGVAPPNGFEVDLPEEWQDKAVELNGQAVEPVADEEDVVRFDSVPASIVLR